MYHRIIAIIIVAIILLIPSITNAQTETVGFKVLESDDKQLLVELTLPEFETKAIDINGITYQQIEMGDTTWGYWGEAGQPQLPMYSTLVGMPQAGQPLVEIVSAEQADYAYRIAPQPYMELGNPPTENFIVDESTYNSNTMFPGEVVQAAENGWLRYQPLFQLRLYPFQYNPTQQKLTVYQRLRVKITFPTNKEARQQTDSASPVFEAVLQQSLLNYDVLPRPAMASRKGRQLTASQASPQIKIAVQEDGFYQISYADIQQVAPNLLTIDPRHLELTYQGTAIPMLIEGEHDGQFDQADYIIFYGQAIDSLITHDNIYWLRDKGSLAIRMAEKDGSVTGAPTPTNFSITTRFEENHLHWQAMPNGEGQDHWFWDTLTRGKQTTTLTFDINNIANFDAILELAVHAATFGERQTQLYINGQAIFATPQTWQGRKPNLFQVLIPANTLVEGTNQLKIENIPTTSIDNDTVDLYIDYFDLTYYDTYIAENDTLRFGVPSAGSHTFKLTNFSLASPIIFDITNPQIPQKLDNIEINQVGNKLEIRFSDTTIANQQYYLQRFDQWLTPQLELDETSLWRSPAHGATYLIITHPSFYNNVQTLATYRRSQGESVEVIKVDDIYDEFNGGIKSAQAIRDFLKFTYEQWSPQPEYVLLVGDASQDPKNYRGTSVSDLMPSYYVDVPLYGETTHDYWFTKVHGSDSYPDMMIGRLPVRYNNQLSAVMSKIETYEQTPPTGDWVQRAILTADDDSPSFANDMENLANLLPSRMSTVKMYDFDPTTSVSDEINRGALLLAYSGHGNENLWSRWQDQYRIFENGHISSLTNGHRLPFMTVGNCLTGFFTHYRCCDSTAERFLLRDNGGGIAVWAPSSYGFPTPNTIIHQKLYENMFQDNQFHLGRAALNAQVKAKTQRPDLSIFFDSFNFFGDPATRLNFPPDIALTSNSSPSPVTIGNSLTYVLHYTIDGVTPARQLSLVNTLPAETTFVSASLSPTSIYTDNLTWDLGDQSPGHYAITITTKVDNNQLTHGQRLLNQAVLRDGADNQSQTSLSTLVQDTPLNGLIATHSTPTEQGEPIQFSAATSTGSNVMYTWDFGDKTLPKTGSTINYTYDEPGLYRVEVTAQNGVSAQTTALTISINSKYQANFTSTAPHLAGEPTSFTSLLTGSGYNYSWDFGDGSPPQTTISHTINYTYTTMNRYTVTLTVETPTNYQETVSQTITILEQPTAQFISNSPVRLGSSIQFTNTSIFGGDEASNIWYQWEFGDGNSSLEIQPSHTYLEVGLYTVTLKIYNQVAEDVMTGTIKIIDTPILSLTVESNSPTSWGESTYLSATLTSGSQVEYLWDFGDGSPLQIGAATMSHSYQDIEQYTVTITATNSVSQVRATTKVVIQDSPPVARFTTSAPDLLGEITHFVSTSSGSNLSYQWYVGDEANDDWQTTASITHSYGAIGSYIVVLTVANSVGQSVASQTIEILQDPTQPIASFESSSPDTVGQTTTFINTSTDGGQSEVTYLWEFGDGNNSTEFQPSHRYTQTGHYSISLTVNTARGSDTVEHEVWITDIPIGGLAIQHNGPTELGQTTLFTATIITGTGVQYAWDTFNGYMNGRSVITQIYPNVGHYLVTLTATNSTGQSVVTTLIHIQDQPIDNLRLSSNSPTHLGQPTIFTVTTDTGTNLTYHWEFGDDSQERKASCHQESDGVRCSSKDNFTDLVSANTPTSQNNLVRGKLSELANVSGNLRFIHTYQTPGTYQVVLTAQNSRGAQATQATVEVFVEPITNLQMDISYPVVMEKMVQFTATTTTGQNLTYLWDFGDGETSTSQTPTHIYRHEGDYLIQLVVSNGLDSQSITRSISVASGQCPLGDEPIQNLVIQNNGPVHIGQPAIFTATVSHGSNISYTWDFGDGSFGYEQTTQHQYSQVGDHVVGLTAQNCWGRLTRSEQIVVREQITFLPMILQ